MARAARPTEFRGKWRDPMARPRGQATVRRFRELRRGREGAPAAPGGGGRGARRRHPRDLAIDGREPAQVLGGDHHFGRSHRANASSTARRSSTSHPLKASGATLGYLREAKNTQASTYLIHAASARRMPAGVRLPQSKSFCGPRGSDARFRHRGVRRLAPVWLEAEFAGVEEAPTQGFAARGQPAQAEPAVRPSSSPQTSARRRICTGAKCSVHLLA
jgi:hypothetical protein